MSSIKVEVGQIWVNGSARFKITKVVLDPTVSGFYCLAQCAIDPHIWSKESTFYDLHADGTPGDWASYWVLESSAAVTTAPVASTLFLPKTEEMKFFRASSHPELCPKCAAPLPCSYH